MRKQLIVLLSCMLGMVATVKAEEETPLGMQMEAMDDAYKAFRRETDPVKGAALAREAQVAAIKAALEIPTLVTGMPEGPEKVKAALNYRKMIAKLLTSFCEVEEAFIDGKIDEVAKIVDSLKSQKKDGHGQFIKEDE